VAAKTIANFIERAFWLYEQERNVVLAVSAPEMYVKRGWGVAHHPHRGYRPAGP